MDVSKSIKFIDICEMMEKIKNAEEIAQKEKHLTRYIDSFQKFSLEFRLEHGRSCKSSFYSVLRCLAPNYDTVRDRYYVKITTLGKIYTRILQLSENSVDAMKLLSPSIPGFRGDYADIVHSVLRNRVTLVPSEKTMFQIHEALDALSTCSKSESESVLSKLMLSVSAFEQKWLIRIILKRLNLGLSDDRILNCFHCKAAEIYHRCANLEKICIAIDRGENPTLIDLVGPFQFIRPMLSERLEVWKLYDLMGADTIYAEIKMDGERFQLHKSGDKFMYFSRNGKDYTKYFGSNRNEGSCTPRLAHLLDHATTAILDGEMMVWNQELGYFCVKGERVDAKHLSATGNLKVCFVVYDLLYWNTENYMVQTYQERMTALDSFLKVEKGVLVRSERTKMCTLQHFQEYFNAALDASEEGVVLKLERSTYRPGFRTAGWFKVKADYIDGLICDMDLVIMGGYYNATKEYLQSYLVGVVEGDQSKATIHCMGTLTSGLSKDERIRLNRCLEQHLKKGFPVSSLNFGNLRPDVWIEPQYSTVLQVKATELAQASSYATSFTVRFPRIQAVRDDKPWYECMTLAEYEDLYTGERGVKKINQRGLLLEDLTAFNPHVQKHIVASKKAYCDPFDASSVEVESKCLDKIVFCVLSTDRKPKGNKEDCPPTTLELKTLIIRHGGRIVENPEPAKTVCIVGEVTCRAKELMSTGLYNVISYTWLYDVLENMTIGIKPRDLLAATPKVSGQIKMLFDSYGDSYLVHVNEVELGKIFKDIDVKNFKLPNLQENEMAALEREIYGEQGSPNFLRNCYGFFYSPNLTDLSHEAILAKAAFQWHGGQCPDISVLNEKKNVKYIFVDPHRLDLVELEMWFLSNFTKHLLKVQIVSIKWVTECEKENKKLPVDDYVLKFRLD